MVPSSVVSPEIGAGGEQRPDDVGRWLLRRAPAAAVADASVAAERADRRRWRRYAATHSGVAPRRSPVPQANGSNAPFFG